MCQFRIERSEAADDLAAEAVPEKYRWCLCQRCQHGMQIENVLDHGIVARLITPAVTAQIHEVDRVFSGDCFRDGQEAQTDVAHAVQHDHGWPAARLDAVGQLVDVQRDAVGIHLDSTGFAHGKIRGSAAAVIGNVPYRVRQRLLSRLVPAPQASAGVLIRRFELTLPHPDLELPK